MDIQRTIDAVWRMESAKLIAALARLTQDVGAAEDLAHDALVVALEKWPTTGIPDNPAAWLMTTARNRALDQMRRSKSFREKQDQVGYEIESAHDPAEPDLDDEIGDDMLRLIFTACHPVLTPDARAALTLRLLGGLTTEEIARAFLVPTPTMAARITRAKKTLADAGIGFDAPGATERATRLASVLEVLYLIFNEGYSASAGDDIVRPALCDDALRLGRVLAALAPDEPEVHALVSLMELQGSRTVARTSPTGDPVLLLDQDRARWDRLMIGRGLASLTRAHQLGGAQGHYALQAAVAACHASAFNAADTDWATIAALYDTMAQLSPSPVVELNRAVAHGMAFGPAAGLALVDPLLGDARLESYHFLPSVRADLLNRLGRVEEARAEFRRAASLTRNSRERDLLLARASSLK